jgi:hypothetical protein
MKVAIIRLLVFAGCSVTAAAAAYYGEPLVRHNTDAILILTTVFTVFAGFLVAIIVILGDPSMVPEGSWRIPETRRDGVEGQLIVHAWLFIAYLLAIGFLFAGVLIRESHSVPEIIKVWINRTYLFLGVLSFLMTFGLAKSMVAFQLARYDAEIKRRRSATGLKD